MQFRDAIAHWLLFDSPPVLRLNLDALQIDRPNVPDLSVRTQVRDYLDRMAQAHLAPALEHV